VNCDKRKRRFAGVPPAYGQQGIAVANNNRLMVQVKVAKRRPPAVHSGRIAIESEFSLAPLI